MMKSSVQHFATLLTEDATTVRKASYETVDQFEVDRRLLMKHMAQQSSDANHIFPTYVRAYVLL